MKDKSLCQGSSNHNLGNCYRKPSVVRDGKPYCWQHDPDRLARLRRERWDKEKDRLARRDAARGARDRRRELEEAAGMDGLSDDDLRTIASLGGIREMLKAATQ